MEHYNVLDNGDDCVNTIALLHGPPNYIQIYLQLVYKN